MENYYVGTKIVAFFKKCNSGPAILSPVYEGLQVLLLMTTIITCSDCSHIKNISIKRSL